jgi:2-polyprenyl-6-methoxyphenol hydroxylase-like FAD-dependent oxidoreductase
MCETVADVRPRIAIVGGGIGGLATAIALARAGVGVEVLEQAGEIAPLGASLQLGPNALRLLGELGLFPALREVGVLCCAVELRRWDDNRLLHRTGLGPAMQSHFGAPQLDFFRPDLHRILAAAAPDGALRLGARVVGVDQHDRGVEVLLEDGTRRCADAAIAADGINSPLRAQLAGGDDAAFSGTVVYRGVVPAEEVADLGLGHENLYWLGPYRHGVSYWLSARRLLAATVAVQDAAWSQESWTLEVSAEEAVSHLDGWTPHLVERLRRCGTVLRGAVFVRPPIERWVYGRVALLGDSAHAMAPFQAQGAAQAVEDAYVLAECVAADPRDVPAALARYERVRMTRAKNLQISSQAAADTFYLPDGEEQRARDAAYERLHQTLPWGPRQRIWEHDVRDDLRAVPAGSAG